MCGANITRTLRAKYGDDDRRIRRQLQYERFVLPDGADFYALYAQRSAPNLGELINVALEAIEDANKAKLDGVFRNIDFNSEAALGAPPNATNASNICWKTSTTRASTCALHASAPSISSATPTNILIERFASDAGKKAGEFYTPASVSLLLAELLDPQPGERICDPAGGSGSLAIKCVQRIGSSDYALYVQEANGATWALCMMNMFLHNINVTVDNVKWADTLRDPRLRSDSQTLLRFNVVVANPPFSLDKWGAESAAADPFGRFHRGFRRPARATTPSSPHDRDDAARPGAERAGGGDCAARRALSWRQRGAHPPAVDRRTCSTR
jgi:type I restriction enzyme M protein